MVRGVSLLFGICSPVIPPTSLSLDIQHILHISNTPLILPNVCACLRLTSAEGQRCDLDLAAVLVRLEGRWCAGAELSPAEHVWTLAARGARARTVSSMMRVLLIIHRHKLQTYTAHRL